MGEKQYAPHSIHLRGRRSFFDSFPKPRVEIMAVFIVFITHFSDFHIIKFLYEMKEK